MAAVMPAPAVSRHLIPGHEAVSMEVALRASMMGARSFCAMEHVGLNVAADPHRGRGRAGGFHRGGARRRNRPAPGRLHCRPGAGEQIYIQVAGRGLPDEDERRSASVPGCLGLNCLARNSNPFEFRAPFPGFGRVSGFVSGLPGSRVPRPRRPMKQSAGFRRLRRAGFPGRRRRAAAGSGRRSRAGAAWRSFCSGAPPSAAGCRAGTSGCR